MLEELTKRIEDIELNNELTLSADNIEEGRIKDQYYFELSVRKKEKKRNLMKFSVYEGKSPNYKPWIEMFGINRELSIENFHLKYFDSDIETKILDITGDILADGSRVFIEYQHDKDTKEELNKGVPEVCSRLGYELFKRDFTWFKDWYFSEGFHEGSQKLQGEKPIDKAHKNNHYSDIKTKVERFLKKYRDEFEGKLEKETFNRAEKVLEEIKEKQ